MRKICLVCFVFLLICFRLIAAGRIINASSELYSYVDILHSLTSVSTPSSNRPWSEAEARMILGQIETEKLDEEGLALYRRALSLLDQGERFKPTNQFQYSAGADLTYEFYAHANEEDFILESDWARGYNQRKPLFHLYFNFCASDFFYTSFDANFQLARATVLDEYKGYAGSDLISLDGYVGSFKLQDSAHFISKSNAFSSPVYSNFFTDTHDFSFVWPKRAIFSFGGEHWNWSLSRDKLNIGLSQIGNLLVDDYTDFNDFSRLSVFVDGFKYDWILMFFNTLTTSSEVPNTESRVFMIHTIEVNPWDKLSLKISENVMYKYTTIDFQFLNPAFIFHNLNNRLLFNAIAYLEADLSLAKGLNLYGQYAMDQARAPNEGYSQSDSYGYIVGLKYTNQAFKGFFESYSEFAYTSPLLYRRDYIDFIKVTRYYHQDKFGVSPYSGHIPIFEYIGFQFGGDTIALKIGTKFTKPGIFDSEISLLLLEHGQMDLYTSHNSGGRNEGDADFSGFSPSGDVITRALDLSAKGNASLESLFKWPGISFQFQLDWIMRASYTKNTRQYNDIQKDTQLSLSLTVSV